ncbi:hypothetical protein UA32_11945 [Photobacterium angustum]|nr:hypothetical protein UA32_11945 [Photobacterium angustum]
MNRSVFLPLLASVMISANVNAENQQINQEYPSVLTDAERDGYLKIIDSKTVSEIENMRAIMTQSDDGKYRIYWQTTGKNGYISTGDIVTESGFALSSKYAPLLTPAQNETFDKLFNDGLILGDTEPKKDSNSTLYVFYEPFCSYCKKLHTNLQPYLDRGLDMKMIPVSWISPQSPDVIATLQSSSNFKDALARSDRGTLDITAKADADLIEKLNFNRSIMASLGISGTPGVVFKDKNNKLQITGGVNGKALENIVNPLIERAKQ